jgi:hypothetical protein
LPEAEIKAGGNLVVSSDCRYCDTTKTRYEWAVEGVEQVVSNEDYYQISEEHVLKQINVTATAVGFSGE